MLNQLTAKIRDTVEKENKAKTKLLLGDWSLGFDIVSWILKGTIEYIRILVHLLPEDPNSMIPESWFNFHFFSWPQTLTKPSFVKPSFIAKVQRVGNGSGEKSCKTTLQVAVGSRRSTDQFGQFWGRLFQSINYERFSKRCSLASLGLAQVSALATLVALCFQLWVSSQHVTRYRIHTKLYQKNQLDNSQNMHDDLSTCPSCLSCAARRVRPRRTWKQENVPWKSTLIFLSQYVSKENAGMGDTFLPFIREATCEPFRRHSRGFLSCSQQKSVSPTSSIFFYKNDSLASSIWHDLVSIYVVGHGSSLGWNLISWFTKSKIP